MAQTQNTYKMKLSILIPTVESREGELNMLSEKLYKQIFDDELHEVVELCINIDKGEKSIGQKRNELLKAATGKYVAFFDDDDRPAQNYLEILMRGINYGADVVSLKGVMTTDGENPEIFEHSLKYSEYRTNYHAGQGIKYERYPNHLNCIKASIAKQFKFKEIDHGEDTIWATEINDAEVLKKEYYSDDIIYYYQYKSKK